MNHAELQNSIPLLALGGLPADEQARLEQHLETCPGCRALFAEYSFVAEELSQQVPAYQAPASLGAKLTQRFPKIPIALPTVKPGRRFADIPRWAFAMGALLVLFILAGFGVLLYSTQQRQPTAQSGEQVAALFTRQDRKIVQLGNEANAATSPDGFICLVTDKSTALVWLYNLPQLDSDHVYQLWLRNGTQRDNGGLFRADNDGRAIFLVNAPQPLGQYTDLGVTVEPAHGSPGPTGSRVIGGKLD